MPVDDHPVHPSTQKGAEFRYGCWNRKAFADGYYAPNRFMPYHSPDTISNQFLIGAKFIRHVMTRDCRYDLGHNDPACNGCKHRRAP